MGSQPAKPKPLSAESKPVEKPQHSKSWLRMKAERQINLNEMIELSQKTSQPLDSIDKAIQYLEKQGIIVEKGLLGVGGCGFVLRACSEWNDHLAVKFMRYTNQEQFESNKREFEILKKFNSPYITKVFNCFTESHESIEYQIIVMERYDLKNYITKKISSSKNLNHQVFYSLCYQLARGLQELHSKNTLHLDIKPANILFGIDLKWKYADLGVSKIVSDQRQHTKNLSDVYSLGVVFLQLTGVDVTQKWVIKEKISPGNYNKCLNPYYEEFNNRVIKRMIQYKPSERLEIQEIISILKELKDNKSNYVVKVTNSAEPNKYHKSSLENSPQDDKKPHIPNKENDNNFEHKSEQQNDNVKVLHVQKAVKKIRVRPISITNSLQQGDFQGSLSHVSQSERARNTSLHQFSSPTLNHHHNKLNLKLPNISPSQGSNDSHALLSTRDSKNKFQSSLVDFDLPHSSNNFDKKSSNNLPSINEIESPARNKKEEPFLPKINSKQNIQYLNLEQQYQSQQQIIIQSSQQNRSRKYFGSPLYQAKRDKFYKFNNNNNIFSTPFLPH